MVDAGTDLARTGNREGDNDEGWAERCGFVNMGSRQLGGGEGLEGRRRFVDTGLTGSHLEGNKVDTNRSAISVILDGILNVPKPSLGIHF